MLDILYETDTWVILAFFLTLMALSAEVGFRRGLRVRPTTTNQIRAQIGIVQGSLMGILGLLLAFTMSMAVTRFETRRQLLVAEANAISTSYLRTSVMPEPDGAALSKALREYVDLRVKAVTADYNRAHLLRLHEQSRRLQDGFWSLASTTVRKNPDAARALILQSLNEAIDLEEARWESLDNHVPSTIIYTNAALALLTAFLVGYAFGTDGLRHALSLNLLALALTLILGVILDIDRPRRGFLTINPQPMIDLQYALRPPE